MKAQSITENSIHLCYMALMNAYLVREPDGLTLIDTTISGAAQGILMAAQYLNAPIRRIALTHAHIDHIGALDGIAAQLPGVEVMISEREAPLAAKPPDKSLRAGDPAGAGGSVPGGYPGATTVPTRLLHDGDRVGSLRVIATPGHTPGHVSYFDTRDGTLFTGDEFVTVGGKLHLSGFGPWYFPFPKFATWHVPSVIASAERLRTEPVQRFAPGHGPVLTGDTALLTSALQSAKH